MKLLVDEAMSWRVARMLTASGHDAVHVDRVGLSGCPDVEVYEFARREGRTVITRDGDYSALWRHAVDGRPSVILMRTHSSSAKDLAGMISEHIPQFENDVDAGAFVTFEPDAIRIQRWDVDA